jgi:hypothetical protein
MRPVFKYKVRGPNGALTSARPLPAFTTKWGILVIVEPPFITFRKPLRELRLGKLVNSCSEEQMRDLRSEKGICVHASEGKVDRLRKY